MKNLQRKFAFAASLAALLSIGGCFLDDDADESGPPMVTEVPDSAGVSSAAFTSYLLSLDRADESTEPQLIKGIFAVPDDDGGEPVVLPAS